jgi:hypothetical protein
MTGYARLMLFIALPILFGCNDDEVAPPQPEQIALNVTLQPYFGQNTLQLDQVFTSPEGYDIQFTELKCYFSSFSGGSKPLFDAALFDYRERGTALYNGFGNPDDFNTLSGLLGVDSAFNHDDPSAFPNDNPLNIMIANDMHWDWNPGYIFLKVEAKVDTLNDGVPNFNHFVIFHVGSDVITQNLSFNNLTWNASGESAYTLPLKLDMKTFLDNGVTSFALKNEFTSHNMPGQEAISLKVMQQLKQALSPL